MARKTQVTKPVKKSTQELFSKIEEAIKNTEYYFTEHGEMRSLTRKNVTDEEILRILEGKNKRHEKSKDKYEEGRVDWNYHITGRNTDDEAIRIVTSFDEFGMVIITVINLGEDKL